MSAKRIRALSIAHTVHRNGYSGPAWELPATAEAYETMVEQMALAAFGTTAQGASDVAKYRIGQALRAIGITPPARQARKGLQKGTP